MPYPNEHSCRLEDPKKFDRFARNNGEQKHDGKPIDVIWGIPKEGGSEIQALRYPKDKWSEEAARTHCQSRKGNFEAAGKEERSKLVCVSPIGDGAPVQWQLWPRGWVKLEGEEPFFVDDEAMTQVISNFDRRGNDMVIDYEHQTLSGEKAPAAGWITGFEIKEDGLWVNSTWTQTAQKHLEEREYRYFSPVFEVRSSDHRPVVIHSVALTNSPLTNQLRALVNKLDVTKEAKMDVIKQLGKILKLEGELTDEAVVEAVKAKMGIFVDLSKLVEVDGETDLIEAIKAKMTPAEVVACKEVLEALGADEKDSVEKVIARITELRKDQGDKGDLETKLAKLIKDHEDLKKKWDERDRDDRVNKAILAGKITPAQKDWADEYALRDPKGFDAFIAKQPQVVPTKELEMGEPPGGGTPAEKIEALIAKKQKENSELSYEDAMNQVAKENPDLAKEYLAASRKKE